MSDLQKVHDSRKIFFLFVPAVTEEMFIKKIIAHEYEAYLLSEDVALYLPVLQTFPDSIIFAYGTNCPRNINWKDYNDKLTICCHYAGIKISTWFNENGLLKVNEDLTNFTPVSKSIDFRSDSDAIFSHLLEMLESMSARGRRNSIRVTCDDGYSATFSIKILKNIYSGTILDISSV